MKRKLWIPLLALALALLLPLVMPTVRAEEPDVLASGKSLNTSWTIYEDGRMIVSGSGNMDTYSSTLYIPWRNYLSSITSLYVDSGVTRLPDNMLKGAENLREVTIRADLAYVATSAFYDCKSLTRVRIGSEAADNDSWDRGVLITAPNIQVNGFSGCSLLDRLEIRSGSIGSYCFARTGIRELDLSGSEITSIGNYAFSDCVALTTVHLPGTVRWINECAFYSCYDLKSFILDPGTSNVSFGKDCFENDNLLEQVVLPENITSLSNGPFPNLTELVLPASLTSLGNPGDCGYLRFTGDKPEIAEGALSDCVCFFPADNPTYTAGTEIVLDYWNKEHYIYWIPEGTVRELFTVSLGPGAAARMMSTGLLTLSGTGDGRINLGQNPYNVHKLVRSLAVMPGITSIDESICSDSHLLQSVSLPSGITEIPNKAFQFCYRLKSISLPDTLTSIGDSAFMNCRSLERFSMPDSVTTLGRESFSGAYIGQLHLSESLTEIPYHAFSGSRLGSVTFPEGLTKIAEGAFLLSDLREVTLPDSITTLGYNAFSACNQLTYAKLPAGLNSCSYPFDSCTSLVEVVLPEGITSLNGAFRNCSALEELTLPSTVTSTDYICESCTALRSIRIPASVTTVGSHAFGHCSSLREVTFEEGVSRIDSYAFFRAGLEEVWFPSTLKSLNYSSFWIEDNDQVYHFTGGPVTMDRSAFCIYGNVQVTAFYPYGKGWMMDTSDDIPEVDGIDRWICDYGTPERLELEVPAPSTVVHMPLEARDFAPKVIYSSGAKRTPDYSAVQMTQVDYSTSGRKAVTLEVNGLSASGWACVHNWTADPIPPVESEHPYAPFTSQTYTISKPGAVSITLEFWGGSELGAGDFLQVLDSSGTVLQTYTGTQADGQSLTVKGDTVSLWLLADGSGEGYGFTVSGQYTSMIHDYTSADIAPTCTEPGMHGGSHCAICNLIYSEGTEVPALGHSWDSGVETIPATETQTGLMTFTCTRCGQTRTEEIPVLANPAESFTDLNPSKWYYPAVEYALRSGLMKGMSDTTFAPNATMTRAQLAQIFWNLAGQPKAQIANPFTDVKPGKWYTEAIVWAYGEGIVAGLSPDTYGLNNQVTREQVVSMLFRYAGAAPVEGNHLSSFNDGNMVHSWALNAMNWAVANGYIEGSNNNLTPRSNMTRAQVAQFFMSYLKSVG